MRTPLLVDTSTTFDAYLKRLSKSSKKKYKAARCDLSFNEVPYDPVVMEQFIRLWEKQVVFGFHPKWSVPMSVMNKLNLVMFDIGGIAIHAIEKCGDYAYAHPPLYDKKNNIARYIWFKTIEWCCEHDVNYLDLGGQAGRDWPTLIRQRKSIPRLRYKWVYVPQDVKDHPESQPCYYQLRCQCGWKQLSLSQEPCRGCGSQ